MNSADRFQYIMDGYHVSHDPAKPFTKEPTTGRSLNILDVPKSSATAPTASAKKVSRNSVEIPTGRGLSPSRIVAPKPSKPYASRKVREADYASSPVDDLSSQLEKAEIFSDYGSTSPLSSVSGGSSDVSSSRGSASSSPSSLSSLSDRSASSCRCNRWGITRKGDKVLLDCGGSRCGYSDDSSSCCSESSSEDEAAPQRRRQQARQTGRAAVSTRRR